MKPGRTADAPATSSRVGIALAMRSAISSGFMRACRANFMARFDE